MTSGVLRSTSTLIAVLEDVSVASIAGNDRQVLVTTTKGRVLVSETAPLPAAQRFHKARNNLLTCSKQPINTFKQPI